MVIYIKLENILIFGNLNVKYFLIIKKYKDYIRRDFVFEVILLFYNIYMVIWDEEKLMKNIKRFYIYNFRWLVR